MNDETTMNDELENVLFSHVYHYMEQFQNKKQLFFKI